MTEQNAVLDGKMDNERLGGLQRRYNEITRRVNEKTLDYDEVMGRLQLIVEDNPVVVSTEPTEKFGLFKELGIIVVPDDYDPNTQLASFKRKNHKKFYHYNDDISDQNFPNPSRKLEPGKKYRVRAYKQIVPGATTSEERMAFLATQGAVYTGAQGVSLVFDQKRDQLPKGYWYSSFDEKERLFKDADGDHRVPSINVYDDGDFDFDLGCFESTWSENDIILCFSDFEESLEA